MSRRELIETSRTRRAVLTAAVALAVSVGAGSAAAQEQQITALAGGATGSWFRALTAMSECLRQHSDLRMTVVPSSGGMEQFVRLADGQGQVGFNYQSVAYPAWNSRGVFEGRPSVRSIRAIGVAEAAAPAHFVVLADSDIHSVTDLAGKQFAPGPVGTVTYQVNLGFLKAVGLDGKVDVSNVSHSEMVSYLRDGRIDGWALLGGLPNPAATEQASTAPIRLLDVGKEMNESGFLRENPFFVSATIPAGTYHGIDEDITTFAQNGILFAHADAPDDLIYNLASTLWSPECVSYLGSSHRALSAMQGSPVEGLSMPLHPGAARLWKERGLDLSAVPTPESM